MAQPGPGHPGHPSKFCISSLTSTASRGLMASGEVEAGSARIAGWGKAPMVSGREERPYFFLSYARTPKRDPADKEDPDRWGYKLYKDLCAVILQLTEADAGEAGFMYRENKIRTEWSPELVNALQRCRVFVPLYSRRYFESKYCGKEWFAFARREINSRARGDVPSSAIVPALWTRLGNKIGS